MSHFVCLAFAGALLVATPSAIGAPAPNPSLIGPTIKQAFDLLGDGEYLKSLDTLDAGSRGSGDSDNNPFAQLREQVGMLVTGAMQPSAPPEQIVAPKPDEASQLARAELRDAIGEIVKRAKQTSIVILNEEHISSRGRAFGLKVARALRPLGYSVLAAEAFENDLDDARSERTMAALVADGYPRMSLGLYTRDPVFGDFIRQSLALGYRPVSYEYLQEPTAPPPSDAIAAREQGQADNLVRKIFSRDPTARVLIYVGYSHVAESPIGSIEWMASRLKRLTGIDPLTIDQTTFSPRSFSGEARGWYAALARRSLHRSVIPMLAGKPLKLGAAGRCRRPSSHAPSSNLRERPP